MTSSTLTKKEQLSKAVCDAVLGDNYEHEAAVAMRLSWLKTQGVHPEDSCPMTTGWGASYELDQLDQVTGGQGSAVDQDARQLLAALMIAKQLKDCIDDEKIVPLADFLPEGLRSLVDSFVA